MARIFKPPRALVEKMDREEKQNAKLVSERRAALLDQLRASLRLSRIKSQINQHSTEAIGDGTMICTYKDEIGWVAWKGWNMAVYGQGDCEEEAIADLNMQLEIVRKMQPEGIKPWQNS